MGSDLAGRTPLSGASFISTGVENLVVCECTAFSEGAFVFSFPWRGIHFLDRGATRGRAIGGRSSFRLSFLVWSVSSSRASISHPGRQCSGKMGPMHFLGGRGGYSMSLWSDVGRVSLAS